MDIFANTHGNSPFGLCSGTASLLDVDYLASRNQGVVHGLNCAICRGNTIKS